MMNRIKKAWNNMSTDDKMICVWGLGMELGLTTITCGAMHAGLPMMLGAGLLIAIIASSVAVVKITAQI